MSDETPQRGRASRRTFLRGAGIGAGATVVGAALVAAGIEPAAAATETAEKEGSAGPRLEGSLVAHVSDLGSGRMSLLFDGHEVVVTDPALARALARKAR
jgi:hypothetical protein